MQFKHLFLTITFLSNLLLAGFAQEPILLEHGGGVRTVEFSPVDASLVASAGGEQSYQTLESAERYRDDPQRSHRYRQFDCIFSQWRVTRERQRRQNHQTLERP